MTAHSGRRAIGLALGVALIAGCGVPLHWKRIDVSDHAPVGGVRYVLKRPAYEASIAFVGDPAQAPNSVLRVTQTMSGEPIVYEATSDVNPLADTEVEIKIADDGSLTALSGGETDRSIEILEAGLDLAKTAALAAEAVEGGAENPCLNLLQRIAGHIANERKPMADLAVSLAARIQQEEADLRTALGGKAPVAHKIAGLHSLRAESERVYQSLEEDRMALDESDFSVLVKEPGRCGKNPCPAYRAQGQASACIQVELQLERSL
ncbi:MAG TPA: hypothetical protein VMS55_27275 [Myxococcota bacterium]|nr:hypothetical protein [Myxococcota bacterium]